MDLRQNKMESLLVMLGEAQDSGAFSNSTTRYPWRTEAVAIQNRGQRRFSWFWVGGPVAAAAAVAVLFVGPNLFPTRTTSDLAMNGSSVVTSVQPELHADAASSDSLFGERGCDFNGDGVINGLDIQAGSDRLQEVAGDPDAMAKALRDMKQLERCLLDSN